MTRTMNTQQRTFEEWLSLVDRAIAGYCGLSHEDIADQPWRDWYESGYEPREAAIEALDEEGFPFDEEE